MLFRAMIVLSSKKIILTYLKYFDVFKVFDLLMTQDSSLRKEALLGVFGIRDIRGKNYRDTGYLRKNL